MQPRQPVVKASFVNPDVSSDPPEIQLADFKIHTKEVNVLPTKVNNSVVSYTELYLIVSCHERSFLFVAQT